MALSFDSTPNPAPVLNNQVTWTTSGGDGSEITWGAEPTNGNTDLPVSVTGIGSGTSATVTALAQGMANITATQSGQTISRYVGVGGMYTYDESNLQGATSDQWTVAQKPDELPTFDEMQTAHAGVAYVENSVVLNIAALGAARDGFDQTCYFSATTTTEGDTSRLDPNCTIFAYAPDGTLWQVTADQGPITCVPSDFPTRSDMDTRNAGLSWAAPSGLPTSAVTGASVTCYVLDMEQFPAASTDGITYYTVTRQRVDIRTTIVQPGEIATFKFDDAVVSAVVGISYWSLTYEGSTAPQTRRIEVSVGTLSLSGASVSALVSAKLEGQGTNVDISNSTIHLCCIAVLVQADPQLVLGAASVKSGHQSSYFNTSWPAGISQAFVAGWHASYGSENNHHVKNFRTLAGTTFQTSGGAGQTAITNTVVMEDNSGNSAQGYKPHLDGGLVVTGTRETGLVCTMTGYKQTTQSFEMEMPQAVSSVAPLIQDLVISYGANTDHDIHTIGGGTTDWTVSGDGMKVTFNNARGFASDNHNSQDDSSSYVNLVVFGIPR